MNKSEERENNYKSILQHEGRKNMMPYEIYIKDTFFKPLDNYGWDETHE